MKNRKITIIDETLREGMQYKGLMFSLEQRLKILKFQEKLKVDICQAGYPPAHDFEALAVRTLFDHAGKNKFKIRIAAMGRASINDAAILLKTRVNDLHFHLHVKNKENKLDKILKNLLKTIDFVRKENPGAVLSVAMLDIGKSDDVILNQCVSFLNHHHIDIISLPDTSGMMAPNQVFEKINQFSSNTGQANISIHCHNDMGMATANCVMGILAGGNVMEASVLGIGERNGIADLYASAKTLKEQGFDINLKTDDIKTFKAYYQYIDSIAYEQTHEHLLTNTTPFFGNAVKTHVAGTHADGIYGLAIEEQFFLNILCGKTLVKKYLDTHDINFPENKLDILTLNIKSESARLNRCLTLCDIKTIISLISG
ncbi:MAG: hypothetical protein GXP56_18500 [Deltaproteobacteria bacterium]|nr:hypothetical protein [Deltaproteobacteria bacterium]